MEYEEAPAAVSSAGTTLTYRHAERPVVKVFLPQRAGRRGYASLFWRGLGDLKSLARFFTSIEPLALNAIEDLAAGLEGRRIAGPVPPLKHSDPRLYWHVDGGDTAFDIWADLQAREGGLTPEVGVAMAPAALAADPMRGACIDLIVDTADWRPSGRAEVQALMETVNRRVAGFDAPPALSSGAS